MSDMPENEDIKWLREHGMLYIIDKLPHVPREICEEHSNVEAGRCDKLCPYYDKCRPVLEELARALEVELVGG